MTKTDLRFHSVSKGLVLSIYLFRSIQVTQKIQLPHNTVYLIYDSSFPFLRCFSITALETNGINNYKCKKCGPQHLPCMQATLSHMIMICMSRHVEVIQCHLLAVYCLLFQSAGPPGGGGGYSQKNWVGVCGPLPKFRPYL